MVYRTGPCPRAATQADQTDLTHTTYVHNSATYALGEPLFYPNMPGGILRDLPTTNSTCTSAGGGGGCGLLASSSSSITALQHTHGQRDTHMRSGDLPGSAICGHSGHYVRDALMNLHHAHIYVCTSAGTLHTYPSLVAVRLTVSSSLSLTSNHT